MNRSVHSLSKSTRNLGLGPFGGGAWPLPEGLPMGVLDGFLDDIKAVGEE